ncbi:Sorting nexin-16 [Tupaia chinensis]|uniref:Sorting nexin-16 n=1 Tax=Tupaia chinensis TaxID=246437 RepID=L8Y683_TUPCH|nr:Sorting nexin-16 [Tupaia chinensis]
MATPYVPVPMPLGNSSSSFTTNRNQRRSSFSSISTSSNSSKGQLEDSTMGNCKQTGVPEHTDSTSVCSSPLIRTKFTGADSSIEYSTRPRETEEQNPDTVNWEDRPSTPTILGYEVMEERAKFTAFCETLEETNYHLQKELLEKQKEVESLKKLLHDKQLYIDTLENRIRTLSLEPEESLYVSGAESGQILKVESSALEIDQDVLDEESRADSKPHLSFSEPENTISEIEVAEVAYNAEED